jgi:ribonuclease III
VSIPHAFGNPALLRQALTHPSLLTEEPGEAHNQRLEFLGDAVLQLVVTDWLCKARPGWPEGMLTRARQRLVNAPALASLADAWGLSGQLRVGKGERTTAVAENLNVRADAFEAVVAAIYLDAGIEAVVRAVVPMFAPLLDGIDALADPRSRLMEWAQGRGEPVPVYTVVGERGPAHAVAFAVSVEVGGSTYGPAEAGKKKEAAAKAALIALQALGCMDGDPPVRG